MADKALGVSEGKSMFRWRSWLGEAAVARSAYLEGVNKANQVADFRMLLR